VSFSSVFFPSYSPQKPKQKFIFRLDLVPATFLASRILSILCVVEFVCCTLQLLLVTCVFVFSSPCSCLFTPGAPPFHLAARLPFCRSAAGPVHPPARVCERIVKKKRKESNRKKRKVKKKRGTGKESGQRTAANPPYTRRDRFRLDRPFPPPHLHNAP
jgi:hypothetical protein